MVNGVLYFTIPDHVFAVERTHRRELSGSTTGRITAATWWAIAASACTATGSTFWHPTAGSFRSTPPTGKERWRKKVADEKLQYFTTMAPLVVKNHVLVGRERRCHGCARLPGIARSGDRRLQWRWWTEPRKPGEPGSETWPNQAAMDHGGGMTWMPGTYDPELNLLYWGTGNANPVYAGQSRKGANLWTASIVALNPDTGKLVWWFQASPHDTHDWDNVETPVLFDASHRRPAAQAAGAGGALRLSSFVLDRTNGKNLVSKGFIGVNWSKGIDAKGQPIPDPAKEPKVDGSLIDTPAGGGTNWPAPSYDPETGLFYVNGNARLQHRLSHRYRSEAGRLWRARRRSVEPITEAIDYKTGNIAWKHVYPSGGFGNAFPGILTTAGKLLFTGDPSGNLIAYDPQMASHYGICGLIRW